MSIKKLKFYDLIYKNGLPAVSDREYDDYRDKEFKKNPNDPYFDTIGAPVDDREKVELPFILGSLKKTKIKKDDEKIGSVVRWIKKQNDRIVVSPKLDGNSILVLFSSGNVTKAYRRGDGEYGQNITNIAKKFISPIKDERVRWVRGEVILDFLPPEYKHKTAAVAGILNDAESKYHKDLKVIFYENINSGIDTEYDRLYYLENLIGLSTVEYKSVDFNNIDNIEEYLINYLKEIKDKYNNRGIEIDGLVLTKNKSERENVKIPDNKVAFKVNQEAVPAIVNYIDNNTSRKGRIIPVLHIDPVEIGGSTITKVTAHNYKYIIDKGICVGSKITIIKSGEVIPYIVDVEDGGDAILPISCNVCGGDLVMEGVDLLCKNKDCSIQNFKKLEHFLKTIGVMGISKTTLINLDVSDINTLYSLTVEDIMKNDGFGKKKANTIVNELKSKLIMSKENFLASLGISGLGNTVSKLILKHIEFDGVWNTKDFTFIDGIGQITSDKIVKGLLENNSVYYDLLKYGLEWKEKTNGSLFSGKIVTLTGTAPIKRPELKILLENINCTVKGISKKVDFLVTNDVNSNSSKTKKAKDFGIPIITYEKLLDGIK